MRNDINAINLAPFIECNIPGKDRVTQQRNERNLHCFIGLPSNERLRKSNMILSKIPNGILTVRALIYVYFMQITKKGFSFAIVDIHIIR